MSLTLDTYKQGDIYVEVFWDKYEPHYHCFVGRILSDGLVHTIKNLTYATEKQARQSFKRQVAKLKKEGTLC